MRVQFVFLYSVPFFFHFARKRTYRRQEDLVESGIIVIGNCGLIYRAYKNYASLGKFIELGVTITISGNRVEQHKLTEREITNEMLD